LTDSTENHPFDTETWAQMPAFFDHLPEPVRLIVWGDVALTKQEREAAAVCQALANQFEQLSYTLLPRRVNYPYYPVIGIMGEGEGDEWEDFGVRIIGLPEGCQMTSFVTAVQSVSFRGMTLDAKSRIHLNRLQKAVSLELLTSAENEVGAIMAQMVFNMAVVSPHIRSFMIMSDQFPEAVLRYSVNYVPHLVINGRVHIEGVVDEDTILKHIAQAIS
jgi:alkyl hydroperoxide reductase subunit AhpF